MAERTRTVAVDIDDAVGEPDAEGFSWPWYVLALSSGAGVALAGWVLVAGVATLVWLTSSNGPVSDALHVATQLYALGHGVPVDLAGQRVGVMPLGLPMLLVFLSMPVVGAAARAAARARGAADVDGNLRLDAERLVWIVAGVHASGHALVAAIITGIVVDGMTAARVLLGAAVVGLVAGTWGAARGIEYDPTSRWPAWLGAVPRAMAAALLVLFAAGAVVLAVAVHRGRANVEAIVTALHADWSGAIALVLLHVLYLPNLILWCCSWLLGAGVTFGDGSLVTLVLSDVGFLPAIPVLGAVPEPGTASMHMLWWLSAGVVAGVVAALTVVWARPRARADETALVGGLAGALTGVAITVLASLASGSLGAERLVRVGARVPELALFASSLLGLAGMLAGLVLGVARPRGSDERPGGDAEETLPVMLGPERPAVHASEEHPHEGNT